MKKWKYMTMSQNVGAGNWEYTKVGHLHYT